MILNNQRIRSCSGYACLLIVSIWIGSTPAFPQAETARYEEKGVFHFDYPANQWTMKSGINDELSWLVHAGELADDPNDASISFHTSVIQTADRVEDVVAYVVGSHESTRSAILISRRDFETDGGDRGYKLEWNLAKPKGSHAVQYFFTGKNKYKIVLDGISPSSKREKYDGIYDGFVRSLVIEK